MRPMDNDTPASLPAPATSVEGKTSAPPLAARRARRFGPIIWVLLLLILGIAAWWWFEQQTRAADSATASATARESALSSEVAGLARQNEQMRRDIDSLRARVADSDTVNRGVREELLGFGERSRALEDAVSNLADQRLTSRDALALNEAEFVLQLAGERLALFHDAAAAMAAYRLADSALSAAEDPLFASVRQTISAEIQALEATQPLQTQATLSALSALRDSLATLPLKSRNAGGDAVNGERSRVHEILSQFVRISDTGSESELVSRDAGLARALAAIDLRTAEAALFSRDVDAFGSAIAHAHRDISQTFDIGAAPVADALATLDRLAATPMAPNLPELGTALRELRNLRTTRVLSRQPVAPIVPAVPEAPPAAESADGGVHL